MVVTVVMVVILVIVIRVGMTVVIVILVVVMSYTRKFASMTAVTSVFPIAVPQPRPITFYTFI